ncbi:hypothetical protein C8Q70DRAFT_288642 [Cubamyces menziesii]|nr:hypothetical protein C8Q70DRAFT_288642 [Cubamyces menziesii]
MHTQRALLSFVLPFRSSYMAQSAYVFPFFTRSSRTITTLGPPFPGRLSSSSLALRSSDPCSCATPRVYVTSSSSQSIRFSPPQPPATKSALLRPLSSCPPSPHTLSLSRPASSSLPPMYLRTWQPAAPRRLPSSSSQHARLNRRVCPLS